MIAAAIALHTLGAVVWVSGVFVIYVSARYDALRPSAGARREPRAALRSSPRRVRGGRACCAGS